MVVERSCRLCRPHLLLTVAALLVLALSCVSLIHAQQPDLAIFIDWPNEGETVYAGPSSLLFKVPASGQVISDQFAPEEITVALEVIHEGRVLGRLTTSPDADGGFEFPLTANPDGLVQQFEIAFTECGYDCHSVGDLNLEPGLIELRFTAEAGGNRVSVTRHITIDLSTNVHLPVMVYLADDNQTPVEGATVSAATWLYMWRTRTTAASTGPGGEADLLLEVLQQAPTEYRLQIEPTVVEGKLITGIDSAYLRLYPGTVPTETIVLRAELQSGGINGTIRAEGAATDSLEVWAVDSRTGEARSVNTAEGGRFTFDRLPISHYFLTFDRDLLNNSGWEYTPIEVDLYDQIKAEVDILLEPLPGKTISGSAAPDEAEMPQEAAFLPFAWIVAEGTDSLAALNPLTSEFQIGGIEREEIEVTAMAPGFYSALAAADLSGQSRQALSFKLKSKSGTTFVDWGVGALVVPDGTSTRLEENQIVLDSGWLWGQGDGPLTIRAAGIEMQTDGARFALEYLPGSRGWLYILDGQVNLRANGAESGITAGKGEMVNLMNGVALSAVPFTPAAFAAFERRISPLEPDWEPSLGARIRLQLVKLGVGSAQIITGLTYLAGFLLLLVTPIVFVIRHYTRRAQQGAGHPQ